MHVLQRPHLPRAIRASIIAALLAIVITLLFATALGDLDQPAAGSTTARHPSPTALSVQSAQSLTGARPTITTPAWLSGPFASPSRAPLP